MNFIRQYTVTLTKDEKACISGAITIDGSNGQKIFKESGMEPKVPGKRLMALIEELLLKAYLKGRDDGAQEVDDERGDY